MSTLTGKMTADFSGLADAFAKYIDYSNRSVPEILKKQVVQLAIGAKGVKGLFQEALSTRPGTVKTIRALPAKLGFRIKREKGRTVKQEIAARVEKAGYYQASGWVVPGIAEPKGKGGRVMTQRGEIVLKGNSISIENSSPGALEFATRTGYLQRAVNARAKDMLKYVENKMASDAQEFSKPKPKFSKSISKQLDELLRR